MIQNRLTITPYFLRQQQQTAPKCLKFSRIFCSKQAVYVYEEIILNSKFHWRCIIKRNFGMSWVNMYTASFLPYEPWSICNLIWNEIIISRLNPLKRQERCVWFCTYIFCFFSSCSKSVISNYYRLWDCKIKQQLWTKYQDLPWPNTYYSCKEHSFFEGKLFWVSNSPFLALHYM